VADFLRGLRAHGSADLNALASTLNDGSLVRESLDYWKGRGWITVAPETPLIALSGPNFDPRLTLRRFVGEESPEIEPPEETVEDGEPDDEDS
jgi:hypothetical protein